MEMIKLLSKTHDFIKIIYLPNKTHNFLNNDKFANKNGKVLFLEKQKYFRWFAVSTCPPGQVLAGPDMSDFRLLVKFRTFRFQNLVFDEISRWFCMVLPGEAQKHVFVLPKNLKFDKNI